DTSVENVVTDHNPVGVEDGTERLWEAVRETRIRVAEQSQNAKKWVLGRTWHAVWSNENLMEFPTNEKGNRFIERQVLQPGLICAKGITRFIWN
ncbi:hypothetical protein L9F63_021290, partial [Diploptera punctata]